jgi:hypothetical protein
MTQLDMLSSITGKNREEEEKKLQKAAANAAWEAKMQGMSEEERAKANAALANAMSVGGQGAVDALQARMMGIPPMTEAGQMFEAMSRNASAALHKQADAVTDSTKSLKDIEKGYGEMLAGSAQDAKNLGKEQMAAMSFTGGVQAEVALNAQKNANLMHSKNLKNAEDVNKLQSDIATDQAARQKSTAAAAAESEQAFKNLGAELMAALMPVMKALTPVIQDLAQQMIQFARDNMPAIKAGLEMVVQFVKDLFSPEGREKVGKQIAEGLGKLLQMAWDSFSLFGNKEDKAKREETNRQYDQGGGNRAGGMDFSAGSFADGGVASGPTSGYMANLHGTEAVVPLPDGRNLPVNLDMKMPQMTDMAKQFQSFKSDLQQNLSEKGTKSPVEDIFASMKESIFGKADSSSTESSATTDGPSKDLLTELQQLNKQTAQMLAYMRDSTDFSRRNLDAIRGLNGNLLI